MDAMHKVTENLYTNVLNREHFRPVFPLLNDPLIVAQQTLLTEIVGAQGKALYYLEPEIYPVSELCFPCTQFVFQCILRIKVPNHFVSGSGTKGYR